MNTASASRFQAFNLALDIIRSLCPLIVVLRQRHPKLAEQCERAADSVALNLNEGRRRTGKDRLHLWRVAAGSADEVLACLLVAEAWGHLSREQTARALGLIDQELAICWKLTH